MLGEGLCTVGEEGEGKVCTTQDHPGSPDWGGGGGGGVAMANTKYY